jgi:hypothetical protein
MHSKIVEVHDGFPLSPEFQEFEPTDEFRCHSGKPVADTSDGSLFDPSAGKLLTNKAYDKSDGWDVSFESSLVE